MGQQSKSILEVGICVTVAIESEEGTLEGRLKKVFVIGLWTRIWCWQWG